MLFRKEVLLKFLDPRTLSIVLPLIDGEILRFQARVYSLIQNYGEYEYESDVNFLGKD
jgi:hypothetical protein